MEVHNRHQPIRAIASTEGRDGFVKVDESRATASACRLRNILSSSPKQSPKLQRLKLPPISASRLAAARDDGHSPSTKLYLAYGSNLCYETFQGKRGIRPLAQLNVVVPALRMTFDLPGIPYVEPCFANSATRDPKDPPSHQEHTSEDYHKDRWKKGMVGVVYEVTHDDYIHIIATEGGGSGYDDVLTQCYPLTSEGDEVPEFPQSESFLAHTLFAPAVPPDDPKHYNGRFSRPDTSYAQPSARYLKLITDGAEEHDLPQEYKDYLHDIRPYETRSLRTKMGRFVFEMVWFPLLLFYIGLAKQYTDKDGHVPTWVARFGAMVFGAVWNSYDGIFKSIFGDGERTDYSKKEEGEKANERERRPRPKHDEEWGEKSLNH